MLKLTLGLCVSLLAAACTTQTTQLGLSGNNPADDRSPTDNAHYHSVTAGFEPHWPVGPKDWRELNRKVGPRGGRSNAH